MLKRTASVLLALLIVALLSGCGATEAVQEKVEGAVKEGVEQVAEQAATKVSEVAEAADETATKTAAAEADEPDTEEQAAEPAATQVEETESQAPEEEPEIESVGEIVGAGDLDSYRLYMVTEWSTEEGTTTSEMWIDAVKEPPASRIRYRAQDANGEFVETETVQVGDVMYTMIGDEEWMVLKSDDMASGIYDDMDLGESDYSDMSGCDRVGKEKVNGLDTIHYHCDQWDSALAIPGVVSAIKSAKVDTWVSTKYNAVIKSETSYVMTDEGKQATVSVDMEYSDINEPIKITAPEGVKAPGLPDDVPLIDGAQDVSFVMQMMTFSVEKPSADVLEWYKTELGKKGWAYEADQSMAPFMVAFSKDGKSLQMMLGEEETTTAVTIVLPEDTQ